MKKISAFTLIELLIVVAIIAILAAIAVPNFLEAQIRSKVSRVKADARSLATGLEAYVVDNNKYPPGTSTSSGITPYVSRLMRLQPLTTPVSYVTAVFPDVFNNKDLAANSIAGEPGHSRSVPKEERRLINYWGPIYKNALVSPPSGTGQIIFAEMPKELDKKEGWLLSSFGPDQIYDVNSPSWPSTLHVYDPTNGTISRGDISRTNITTY
ncbi:MAG: prepilin-type N-terminal cleavage/methylation domain-containing protein [bacterium]